jgi:hypothetical protein
MNVQPPVGADYIFTEIVLPNYREWLDEPLSIRRAYNVAVSIAHMADHVAHRSTPTRSPRAVRKDFMDRCQTFAVVDTMCNAIKHVYATGSRHAPNHVMATATGMTAADPTKVLFVEEIAGEVREHRPVEPMLVFDVHDGLTKRQAWVPWMLYGALRFVAGEIGCERLISERDLPPRTDFVYRVASLNPENGGSQ